MPGYSAWDPARGAEIIAAEAKQDGATLPILHALQRAFGHVPRDAVPMIAQTLNLSRAEVHGVVSFYHDFRHAPAGRHTVKLCRAESCQAMGADDLHRHAQDKLRIGWGETTTDGKVTLEQVFCLGLCACSPSAMIDGKVYGGLDKAKLGALIDKVRAA
ncbi:MAG TPA: formate dehydrogenase subunit gamma [Stellaceae bacterium]|jgi:formate dehydrogenase subunit gamma|nr:formate dehydrogenase subunit gamma [Stellaceae bacterium]